MIIYGLDQEVWNELRLVFERYTEIEEVVLYGSRAKGNFKPFSDVDLTLKGNVTLDTLANVSGELDDSSLPYLFDLSIYNDLTNADLISHIDRCGQTVYTR